MKKVINITIGGIVFAIEEVAYKNLNKYLSSVRDHFQSDPSCEAIMEDIESSIAEKFITKKRNADKAVIQNDVDEVITQLGSVEELTEEELGSKEAPGEIRRLYRNTDDVVVAGVASGIANYFNIDPVITRVLFVIFTFTGGFGILLYLVLWIVVPKAETASQKLAMKGKGTNLESITEYIKEKVQEVPMPTKTLLQKIIQVPIRFIKYGFHFFKKFLPVLSVFFGVVLLVISSLFIFVFTTGLIIFLVGGIPFEMDAGTTQIFNEYLADWSWMPLVVGTYLVLMIPAIFGFLGSLYLIAQKKVLHLGVVILMIFCWMVALGVTIVNVVIHSGDINGFVKSVEARSINAEVDDFYIRISGEDVLGEKIINEDIIPKTTPVPPIPIDSNPLLIGGDAVSTPVVLGQKEFSVIGGAGLFSPSELSVQNGDRVTLRFNTNDNVMKLMIYAFNTQTDFSNGETVETTFLVDKQGIFPIYGQVKGGDPQIMGQLIVQ